MLNWHYPLRRINIIIRTVLCHRFTRSFINFNFAHYLNYITPTIKIKVLALYIFAKTRLFMLK